VSRGGVDEGVRDKARRASNSRPIRSLARSGLIASGIVHVLIGVLAISVTSGLRGRADQSGALKSVAETPGGGLILWAAAVSLVGLGIWQWTGSRTARPDTSKVFSRRLRDHSKALGFVAVGLAAVAFAVGGRPETAKQTRTFSSTLIELPGGVFVLAGIGLIVAGVGVAFVVRGVTRNFREDIAPPKGAIGHIVVGIGVIGHVMKGLALLTVGGLFAGGALFTDSSWASGIDGAVRYLADLPIGSWPAFVLAGGFMVHGLYLVARGVYIRR
jgi:uncharacterized protein YjeT (DUF2065 family)